MKLLMVVLFVGIANLVFASNKDSIYEEDNVVLQEGNATSEIEATYIGESAYKNNNAEEEKEEKSLQEQAEEIPVVFGQWWFWVGLFAIILFLKFVIFKK